jgi:hypothetical protein
LLSARLVTKYGTATLSFGALLAAAGYAVLILQVGDAWPQFDTVDVTPGMLMVGLGQGLLMPPLFGIILSQVPRAQGGLGSGMLITTQQMWLGLGAALVGSLYLSLAEGSVGSRAFTVTVAIVAAALVVIAGLSRFLVPHRAET